MHEKIYKAWSLLLSLFLHFTRFSAIFCASHSPRSAFKRKLQHKAFKQCLQALLYQTNELKKKTLPDGTHKVFPIPQILLTILKTQNFYVTYPSNATNN